MINNLDVQKVFTNNLKHLVQFSVHERHFDFEKAFKNVKLYSLKFFSYMDSPRELSEVGIKEFTKACPNLIQLNFSGCQQVKNNTFKLIVGQLRKLQEIIVLRNNNLTDEFFGILSSKDGTNLNLKRLEIGGKFNEFQHEISFDPFAMFLNFMVGRIETIRFEYCSKVGDEFITKIAETQKGSLRELAVIRNFNEKSAKISDVALNQLATQCPNLKKLEIVYTRKLGNLVAENLGNGNLRNLTYLDLSYCPIAVTLDPLCSGCPALTEFKLAGDSWIRDMALKSIAKHPNLKIFHMGHYEHSDCDCKSVVP